jgi:NTE family protein
VHPDLLIGTSAGAGKAADVAGHGTRRQAHDDHAATWRGLRRGDVFAFDPLRHLLALTGRSDSVCTDRGLRRLVEAHLPYRNLEDAAIPVHIVTTNVLSGEEVLLSDGDALSAVLASAAIPGVLPAVPRGGLTLVDGGVADNAALSQAVALGADEIYVLPAGFACALARPPASALAAAVQAITLLIEQRLCIEIAHHTDGSLGPDRPAHPRTDRLRPHGEDHAHIKVLPPLCPLSVSATDFGHADDLIRRAHDASGEWIDSGGPDLPFPERFLSLHHHRHPAREESACVHAPCPPAPSPHDESCHPTAA